MKKKITNGGESGIRTHGTCEGTHTFQACALNHSAISPKVYYTFIEFNSILLQIEIFDKNYNKLNNLLKNYNFKKIHKISSDGKTDYYYKNY